MRGLLELWIGVQNWIFETLVSPLLFEFGLMAWFEPAFNAIEFVMLGMVQIAVIALVMRFVERRLSKDSNTDKRLIGVDRIYTALNKLGVVPLIVFVVAYPLTQAIEQQVRVWGVAPPRVEHLVPWLYEHPLASFLIYFALYDFAAYWLHRAQHRFSWWWALHSLHHSQREVTVWTDDRNHIVDDFLMTLMLVIFSQLVGVQPDDYVLILMVGRLIESWSHANVDVGFGWFIVGPRFHRLHHALASAEERHIHDHNFAPVLPLWDILFGTAIYDSKVRPTGVDDARIDADNGRGWLGQQIVVFGRFVKALLPRFSRV
jgi:sterol desaturase/sphingolipid hydroxylase (fatty acid hydroxylase superfamily)